MKRAFKMKQKAFFINFKELSLKQIKRNFFGRCESDFNDFPDVIYNIAIYADDTTLSVIRHLIHDNNKSWLLNLNLRPSK